ncbi:MAG TPA: hypothetical protein VGU74_16240 [Gemmatimonadales bacterium]|nr:hypothetical protein [Gemmatimonadales bacterium]
MRILSILLIALAAAPPGSVAAQRRARLGPTVSSISLEDASGKHSYSSFGGSLALLSGDDGEVGVGVSHYDNLSSNTCVRQMTFAGVESNYYPVGSKGLAPYASSALGLARVTDQDVDLLGICTAATPKNEIGIGFGLGVRVNVGAQAVALVEGRFFQVPNSAIQSLEVRANLSLAFGSPRKTDLLNGTLGPTVSILPRLSGPMEGRAPAVGVRFRRNTKKSGVLGLQIDYAPLRVIDCSSDCEPNAILFAPGYEPSLHTAWGRMYVNLGLLLAGFPSTGPDRGMAEGAHGGLGADIFSGSSIMWNVNGRALWMQRNTGENVFLLQVGLSASPQLRR